MSKPVGRAWLFATLASVTLLSACGEPAPEEGAAKTAATAKPKTPKTAGIAPNMVAAVSSGKSAAAIGLHFALTQAPAVNQGLPVDIVLVPHADFTSVAVHFFGQEGITLISGDSLGPISEVTSEKPIKHQLVLMPTKDGIYMINASVETIGADGTVSRIYSIPVVVAPLPTAAPAAPEPGAAAPAASPATPSTQSKPASN